MLEIIINICTIIANAALIAVILRRWRPRR